MRWAASRAIGGAWRPLGGQSASVFVAHVALFFFVITQYRCKLCQKQSRGLKNFNLELLRWISGIDLSGPDKLCRDDSRGITPTDSQEPHAHELAAWGSLIPLWFNSLAYKVEQSLSREASFSLQLFHAKPTCGSAT